jgi:hypothetical protein
MCIMVAIKDVHLCTPKKAPDKQEYIAKASTCGLIAWCSSTSLNDLDDI